MNRVKLSNIIAPPFWSVHSAVKSNKYREIWLKGGRGSTKSSFVGIEIINGIMRDPQANGIVFRKVKDILRTSVYEQLVWAIDALGVMQYWDLCVSPLTLTYIPTGQKILFRGLDEPKKIKSVKLRNGILGRLG